MNGTLRQLHLTKYLKPASVEVMVRRIKALATWRHLLKKKLKGTDYAQLFGDGKKDSEIPLALADIEHCCILIEVIVTLQT